MSKISVEFICPEIWAFIFDKLLLQQTFTGSGELYSCYQACATFQGILYPTRTTWLFQKVIPFLVCNLDGKSILSCRATSKIWRRAVDNLLENEQDYLTIHQRKGRLFQIPFYSVLSIHDGGEYQMVRGTRMWERAILESTMTFNCSTKMGQFLQTFSTRLSNPFPGRTIRIANIKTEENEEHCKLRKEDVVQLLCQFGNHIRTLQLEIGQYPSSVANMYDIINLCLSLTPNLKRLHLGSFSNPHGESEFLDKNLETLPKLPYLESVVFERRHDQGFSDFPLSFQQAIISPYSKQLKKLSLTFPEKYDKLCARWNMATHMPQLDELVVKVTSGSQFASVFLPDCKYESLRTVRIEIADGEHKLGVYLEVLQKFKNSLRTLSFITVPFDWKLTRAWDKDLKILRELHNLQYLRIEGFKLSNVEVVKYLPQNLEYLLLDYKEDTDFTGSNHGRTSWTFGMLGPGVSIDLTDKKGIYMSSLWEQVPRLRWLCVTYSYFPRRVYMYRRENVEWWLEGKGKWNQVIISAIRYFQRKGYVRNSLRNLEHTLWKNWPIVALCCNCMCFCCCCHRNEAAN